jgi:hypothetical protein
MSVINNTIGPGKRLKSDEKLLIHFNGLAAYYFDINFINFCLTVCNMSKDHYGLSDKEEILELAIELAFPLTL